MAQSNRRSNRRQQNKRQSNKRQQNKRQSNKRQQNRRQNRRQNGGDGQMGHTVMTESYYGRPTLGFGELQNAPQTQEQVDAMRGGDAVAGPLEAEPGRAGCKVVVFRGLFAGSDSQMRAGI